MRTHFLPFSSPSLGEEEIREVVACLRSGWLTTGLKTTQFEDAFATFIGCEHAIAVNSCTSALHLALEAAGVRAGHEVITSPMTFAATAAVIEHLNARPVFVDCDPGTFNLDPHAIAQRISPRTRAIIPVHFAGQACDMDPILAVARQHNLSIIEDAAHALPTRYKGMIVGTLGDITCFSFYVTKTLTTGEGGMVVTNNSQYAERIRLMRLHGITRDAWKRYSQNGSWFYEISAPGYKYNLTDIAASIGIPQLHKSHLFYERRKTIAQIYTHALSDIPHIRTPSVMSYGEPSWHLYVILLNLDALAISRDMFIRELGLRKIGVSVHFIPLHIQPYYRKTYGYKPHDYPNAFAAYQRMVSLPIYPAMTDEDVADVVKAVGDIVRRFTR